MSGLAGMIIQPFKNLDIVRIFFVLTIGPSNQNDAKWFDDSIVTIWNRHSDEHARLLCTPEGHTGNGHVSHKIFTATVRIKVRMGALLCNEGECVTNCMTLAILILLSLCIDFAAIKLLV